MENKKVTEFEAILEDVRKILYDNFPANGMSIHILLEKGSYPVINYEVKERKVRF